MKIDSFFQKLSTPPALHVIIEAHPDVREYMRSQGWYSKPNVKILGGKWQDRVGSLELLEVGGFDVIYTDTFSEEYKGDLLHLELEMTRLSATTRTPPILQAASRSCRWSGIAFQLLQWFGSN